MNNTFRALVARNDPEHSVSYEDLTLADLGEGEVTIQVEYSTLNYKDGLAVTNAAPIVQKHPLILGIDLAGTVLESSHDGLSRRGGYRAWQRLAADLDIAKLEALPFDVPFSELLETAPKILAGQVRGRAIVDLSR